MWICLTVLSALAGGLLLAKAKVPAGMLVGAIFGAAALNITTGQAFLYPETRVAAQALAGAYIGAMMTRDSLVQLRGLIRPYLWVMGSLLALNLLMGGVIYFITDLDLLTAMFSATPGGVSDTPLIAMDMGADGSVVALMQFVRMLFGMGCLPYIILLSDRLIEPETAKEMEQRAGQLTRPAKAGRRAAPLAPFLPTFAIALAFGGLGRLSGLPAGTLSFALVATTLWGLSGRGRPMPIWLRRVAQLISGCCIGVGVTRADLLAMGQLALPAVLLCLGYIICCVGMGRIIARRFKMELREAMLTLSPAGATEMALIAADLGVESPNLVLLQICRLIGVVVLFPHVFTLVILLIG